MRRLLDDRDALRPDLRADDGRQNFPQKLEDASKAEESGRHHPHRKVSSTLNISAHNEERAERNCSPPVMALVIDKARI